MSPQENLEFEMALVPHNAQPQAVGALTDPETQRERTAQLETMKTRALNKIDDQLSLISRRFEEERYRLLQQYQEKLGVIHDRETAALGAFIQSIRFEEGKHVRSELYTSVKRIVSNSFKTIF